MLETLFWKSLKTRGLNNSFRKRYPDHPEPFRIAFLNIVRSNYWLLEGGLSRAR